MALNIYSLRPHIRINAPGCPDLLIDDALFHAARNFYKETEAFVEGRSYALSNYNRGANYNDMMLYHDNASPANERDERIVRFRKVTYDGKLLTQKSLEQIVELDPKILDSNYLSDIAESGKPDYFFYVARAGNKDGSESIGFYPPPQDLLNDDVAGINVVIVAAWYPDNADSYIMSGKGSQSGTEFNVRHKEALIAGALAYLLAMPEKQWSNPAVANFYGARFNMMMAETKSAAASDYGQPRRNTTYGGI